MSYAVKAEVKIWLNEARKRKLKVGNSTDNLKGLRRYRGNRKRRLNFPKSIGKVKNSPVSFVCFVRQSGEIGLSFEYPKHVRFRCMRCAICCGDTKDKIRSILLLKIEANHISKSTSTDSDKFAEKIKGFEPYNCQMRKTENGKCVFLKDRSCSIYQIRPLICRFYPFQLKDLGNNRYAFAYTHECQGIGKGPQLKRDFFERFFSKFIGLMRENVRAESLGT